MKLDPSKSTVRAWEESVTIPTYPVPAAGPQSHVPRQARLPGQ